MKKPVTFETFDAHAAGDPGFRCCAVGCSEVANAMLSIYEAGAGGYSVSACYGHFTELGQFLAMAEVPR